MQIIPVIDIKDGIAVHAVAGRRNDYRPLASRFTDSSDPHALVTALRAVLPVRWCYVADLDAIMYARPNTVIIERIARDHADMTLLVDGGFSPARPPTSCLACDNIGVVLASEALAGLDELAALRAALPPPRTLLSLDRKDGERLGAAAVFDTPAAWPARVIHMNLSRVGGDAGPDFAGLATLSARAGPTREVFAAGGVRHRADLLQLRELGIAGVLVGSALHDGRLAADDLAGLD
ncbi:MAG: HisA/HisF-related TIM barrel protein [Gammaproteobacteria bacterium]